MSEETEPPRIVAGYTLQHVLGEGGVARTWLAIDTATGRKHAIKELQLLKASHAKQVELFERECAVLRELKHAQIPHFTETIVERRAETLSLFLVQEFIDGRSLQQLLDAGVRFGPTEVIAFLSSCLAPLEYLHGRPKPLFHRDIKPSNVLLRTDGSCVLVDFGAVREAIADPRAGGSSVVGTFGYMAPEQFQARAYPATDLYALGATALHLATGRDPGMFEIRRLKPDFHAALPDDPHLAAILDLLLEPAVEDRYASVSSLRRAIERWLTNHGGPIDEREVLRAVLERGMSAGAGHQGVGATTAPSSAHPTGVSTHETAPAAPAAANEAAPADASPAEPPGESAAAAAPVAPPTPDLADSPTVPSTETASAAPPPSSPPASVVATPAGASPAAAPGPRTRQRVRTRVPVETQRAGAVEGLVPGGQGAKSSGLALLAVGAGVAAFGLLGGMQYNGHVVAIVGAALLVWGVVLAAAPRRPGASGDPSLRTRGRTAPADVRAVRRRLSAMAPPEWYVDYEYEASDGLHYAGAAKLPDAKTAQRVATDPSCVVVRYNDIDPALSIVVLQG
jgi:hypothetical protein